MTYRELGAAYRARLAEADPGFAARLAEAQAAKPEAESAPAAPADPGDPATWRDDDGDL
jgi:hypothetical protein